MMILNQKIFIVSKITSRIIFISGMMLSLFLMSCAEHWQKTQIFYQSPLVIMQACQETLTTNSYTITSQTSNACQTEWQNHLQPLRPGGYRLQARIFLDTVASSQITGYQVRLQVIRERNYSTQDYFHPLHAHFLPDGYDVKQEMFLIHWITSKLKL